MEVVAGGERAGGPFSRHNVQEWSRLDQLTGMLEHARVETDHWATSTSNSSHHFGKVVDSRSRNLADGGQEQRQQTKQLEVFQANIPGGSVQVIRSSTSSSWQSHKTLSGKSGWSMSDRLALPSSENQDFDHLKLALHPLDLSSQKTKASIGRSGSIGSRRPPSRPRSIVGLKADEASKLPDDSQLTDLSKLCQKVHKEAKKELVSHFRTSTLNHLSNGFNCDQNDNVTNSAFSQLHVAEKKFNLKNNVISEVIQSSSDSTISNHSSVIRKKSCSSEDLYTVTEEESDKVSDNSDWRRTSKVRRSLQFPPKPSPTHKESIVIPITKSVAEIRKEIEARKQIVTNSIKSNHWSTFAEIEGVLSNASNNNTEDQSRDSSSSETGAVSPTKPKKRQTFITAETLKEVRGRLKKLNSPIDEVLKNEDVDDGIDTEVKLLSPLEDSKETSKNSVKSFVFGMEAMLRKAKPTVVCTGSLESRSSNKSITNGSNRSEEWYNRRKSYGFEQVNSQQQTNTYFEKDKIESSTDSGICKSSDIFPSWPKLTEKPSMNQTNMSKTTHSIVIKPYSDDSKVATETENNTVVHKGRKTVVNLTSNVGTSWTWNSKNEDLQSPKDESKERISKGKVADTIKSFHEKSSVDNQKLSEPITISIPVMQQSGKSNNTDSTDLLLKQTSALSEDDIFNSNSSKGIPNYSDLLLGKEIAESSTETKSIFDNIPWRGNRTKTLSNYFDSEFKRHSIAVDQTKYLSGKKTYSSYQFSSSNNQKTDGDPTENALVPYGLLDKESVKGSAESDHEQSANEKKQKKVEFCKTEVHFAAEPGRFNIVETDGKPPPNNMYRRRRKTTSEAPNKSGLPEIRFGDTQYEKQLLSTAENIPSQEKVPVKPLVFRGSPTFIKNEKEDTSSNDGNTALLQSKHKTFIQENETAQPSSELQYSSEDDAPKPRSILKNNIPKPKPYLLGEVPDTTGDNIAWGVKLKSVTDPEMDAQKPHSEPESTKQTEFQKLLKSLRPASTKPPDLIEHSSIAADNGLEVRISSSSFLPDNRRASWSVSERVKPSDEARGYSTKVNFGPQETTVVDFAHRSDRGSLFVTSEPFRSRWLVKEQNSFYDTNPAEEQESSFNSVKKLMYSQSFNSSGNQSPTDSTKGHSSRNNMLKSTSLVLEVQNPTQYPVESEKKMKVSVKEVSTNLIRDNCGKITQKAESSNKLTDNFYKVDSTNHSLQKSTSHIPEQEKYCLKINTNTIPPVRKTSSSTQTYFVNRSSIRKDPHLSTNIKVNAALSETESNKDSGGIPAVLNALDDLSRCIDEVIIESPKKECKRETVVKSNVFKIKEDSKASPQNILSVGSSKLSTISQLDLLREIVDAGEMSDDSLKADEEVRAYMSADNDEDNLSSEWSGSWSRIRTLKAQNRQLTKTDDSPKLVQLSPKQRSPLQQRKETETAANKQVDMPRVTSVCLRYEDQWQPSATSTNAKPAANAQQTSDSVHPAWKTSSTSTNIRPTVSIQETSENGHPAWQTSISANIRPTANEHETSTNSQSAKFFVSKSFLNSNLSEVPLKIDQMTNGDRIWSFSKAKDNASNRSSDSDSVSLQSMNSIHNNRLLVKETTPSPSKFSRKSQSPSRESLFLERTAERNVLYNESKRQMSSSPTSGTSRKGTSTAKVKLESVPFNSDKITYSPKPTPKTSIQPNSALKSRAEEKTDLGKKSDVRKLTSELKSRERKLSASSSGRDGWLNTPKEVPVRKKPEQHVRNQETRKETKPSERSLRMNGLRTTQKRTQSPIYQNREIYAERRDSETESLILEELTKAADQILLAVNGYTDDDSYRASSDDEYRKRRERISQPLCTISELPSKKTNTNKISRQTVGVIKSTRSTDLRKEYHSSSKNKISKTPSNSSMDSSLSQDIKPLLSAEDRSKRRAARLLQRASSRELLFQSAASSSEDLGSGSDTGSLRTKRVYRRPRLQNGRHGGSKHDLSASASESRTKERVQRTAASSETHKSQRTKTQADKRCSRHFKTNAGSSANEQKSGRERERRPQTHSSRTQKSKSVTSQFETKSSGTVRE